MSIEIVKFKIVSEDNGKTLTTYFWHKWFWVFGVWMPYGCKSSNAKIDTSHITNELVATELYHRYIQKHKSPTRNIQIK